MSLVELAHVSGYDATHVNYLGLGSSQDWQLISVVLKQDYTFVTNNGVDFLALYRKETLHSGLVIIVPNVSPARQRELFGVVLAHIGSRDLTNTVIEVEYAGNRVQCIEYAFPPHDAASQ